MKNTKQNFYLAMAILLPLFTFAKFEGYYQTIDDKTFKPKGIVSVYSYGEGEDREVAARLVALYDENGKITETILNPIRIAEKVKGKPKMAGIDVVWGMEWNAKKKRYEDGKIIDPKSGKIYSSLMWKDEDKSKLNVRGKIGPFGRTQVWNALKTEDLPEEIKTLKQEWKEPVERD